MNGQKEITIDFQTHPHLMDLIDKIRFDYLNKDLKKYCKGVYKA